MRRDVAVSVLKLVVSQNSTNTALPYFCSGVTVAF
jgi:hypothetical protein